MRKQNAFLLLEVIIVLFVLSLIVIPWQVFIMAIQKDQSMTQLNDFFLTKEVFIQAYKGEINVGKYLSNGKEFFIGKEDGIIYVRLLEGKTVKEEIKGKSK